MSESTVDDLQAAEDLIGELRDHLERIGAVAAALTRHGPHLVSQLVADALGGTWCRPSCEDHDHDDPDDEEAGYCGCPAHEEPANPG